MSEKGMATVILRTLDKPNANVTVYCWNSNAPLSCCRACNPILIKQAYAQVVAEMHPEYTGNWNCWFFIIFYLVLLLLRSDITDDNRYYVNRELLKVIIMQKCFLPLRNPDDCSTKNKHCLQRDARWNESGILQATANTITEMWMEIISEGNSLSFCQHLECKHHRPQAASAWVSSILPVLLTQIVSTDFCTQLTSALGWKSRCYGSSRVFSLLRLQNIVQYNHDNPGKWNTWTLLTLHESHCQYAFASPQFWLI